MIIFGIDPGFDRMGCAVLQKDKTGEKIVYSTCLVSDRKLPYPKRLLFLGKELEKIFLKHKPDVVAVEKIFFTQNQKTALQISEVRGIILYLASLKNIPIIEFTPLQVKMALTGYGKAEKKQVQKMVEKILNLNKDGKKKLDDEIDAMAMALTALPQLSTGILKPLYKTSLS